MATLNDVKVLMAEIKVMAKDNPTALAMLELEETELSATINSTNDPTPEEIIAQIKEMSDDIIEDLDSIKDLQELNKLETNQYEELEAYYDAYSSSLSTKDQKFYKIKVDKCKKSIDALRLELESNPDDNNDFIKEIEVGIKSIKDSTPTAKTLAEGEALQDEYNELNDKFIAHTENATTLSSAWLKEMRSKLDRLQQDIREKNVELSEEDAQVSNRCETVTWVWTIKEYKKDVVSKEDRIKKRITKISEILKAKFSYDPEEENNKDEDAKGRKKRLIKRLQNLEIKEKVIAMDNSKVTDTEEINVSVVFCEKLRVPTGSDKGKVPYWGIKDIILPEDRATDNDAGFSISSTSTIAENGFSDSAKVSFSLIRGEARQYTINWENLFAAIADVIPTGTDAIDWGQEIAELFRAFSNIIEEGTVDSQDETLEWTVDINTNPEKPSDVSLQVSPKGDHKVLDELSYKKIETVGTWVTYEGDMESANADFIATVKSRLGIK